MMNSRVQYILGKILLVMLLVGIAFPQGAFANEDGQVEEEIETDQIEEAVEEESNGAFDLTIMHMNDSHSHTDRLPKALTAIKAVREENENNLLVHAGDYFSGTLYFNKFKGQADLALFNLFGIDAMIYGNHEFDLGSNEGGHESLAKFVSGANFPFLGTNVDFSKDPFMKSLEVKTPLIENPAGGKTYHSIVKEIDGEKVGIFGLTTEDTPAIASPMSVTFANYKQTAENTVKQFEEAGINKIIAVTHIGYDSNPAVGNDLLLSQVDGIDVIVGGHSHTTLPEPIVMNHKGQDPTLIVQTGQYVDNLGVLDVTFDEDGVITHHEGGLKDLSEVAEDDQAVSILEIYKTEVDAMQNEETGAIAVETLLNPRLSDEENNGSVRANETPLGNLVTDAMLAKAREKFPETMIALQNGGGIRASIEAGPITIGEIIAVLPFGNDPVVATITGAELKEVLEHSVSQAPNENGGFLHVAGMRYYYDSREAVGNRVIQMDVLIDGDYVAVELDKQYMITTNQFTAQGGDGFETFAKVYAEGRVTNIGEIDWEQLKNYMVEEQYLNGTVHPKVEGRILDAATDELPNSEEETEVPDEPEEPTEPGDPSKPGEGKLEAGKPEDPENPNGPEKPEDPSNPESENTPGTPNNPEKTEVSVEEDDVTNDPTGNKLPETATNMFTILFIGLAILFVGVIFCGWRRVAQE